MMRADPLFAWSSFFPQDVRSSLVKPGNRAAKFEEKSAAEISAFGKSLVEMNEVTNTHIYMDPCCEFLKIPPVNSLSNP